MSTALIGHTGFIGQTLLRQCQFDYVYSAHDVIQGSLSVRHDLVCCAAMPGSKRTANEFPVTDYDTLTRVCAMIGDGRKALVIPKSATVVLVSTVDVFSSPEKVDEGSPVVEEGPLHSYGLHRRYLERYVETHFGNRLIVRLPSVVGPGLKKNVVYDLHNAVHLGNIHPESTYQFYPVVNLWYDIMDALKRGLKLIHLNAEPISVEEIAKECFGRTLACPLVDTAPEHYDVWSNHQLVGPAAAKYHYSKRESIQAIRAYAQSEPRTP